MVEKHSDIDVLLLYYGLIGLHCNIYSLHTAQCMQPRLHEETKKLTRDIIIACSRILLVTGRFCHPRSSSERHAVTMLRPGLRATYHDAVHPTSTVIL